MVGGGGEIGLVRGRTEKEWQRSWLESRGNSRRAARKSKKKAAGAVEAVGGRAAELWLMVEWMAGGAWTMKRCERAA